MRGNDVGSGHSFSGLALLAHTRTRTNTHSPTARRRETGAVRARRAVALFVVAEMKGRGCEGERLLARREGGRRRMSGGRRRGCMRA